TSLPNSPTKVCGSEAGFASWEINAIPYALADTLDMVVGGVVLSLADRATCTESRRIDRC
ncbi:MAG: hypothetical protein ACK5XN_09075, partial [Bacteroidota bacterium]